MNFRPVLFLAFLLAGCASSPSPDPTTPVVVQEDTTVRWLNGTIDLTLSGTEVAGQGTSLGEQNCLEWERSQMSRILPGGVAVATWTANPTSQVLQLVAGNLSGPPNSIDGASPLRIDVEPKDVAPRGFFIAIRVPDPGAVLNQSVHLEWKIPYLGEEDPKPTPTSC